jgi:hypothetical protein
MFAEERDVGSKQREELLGNLRLRENTVRNRSGDGDDGIGIGVTGKKLAGRPLMKLVDDVVELVRVDRAGAPSREGGLEFGQLSGELTVVGEASKLT